MESYSSTQALVRFTAHTHNPEIQFVYWDCDVEGWRMATWSMTLKERHD